MWHSDIKTNPFPIPFPGACFFKIPTKTAHSVFSTLLNAMWDTVAPQILALMKTHGLQYSVLKTVCFLIVEDSKKETFGPVVVWIAVCPNTTDTRAVCNATPDILHILTDTQITSVIVKWYEGLVQQLVSPPLMSVVEAKCSPKFGLNHPFNTGLGIPITRQSNNTQGTLMFLFQEMKTSNGDPSNRILALTNKHTASINTTTDYKFDRANPQHILVCGDHCLTCAVAKIKDAINTGFCDAVELAGELVEFESKSGNQYSTHQLGELFWPIAAIREGRRIPANLQLPILHTLSHCLIMNPNMEDKNGEPFYIVTKYGNTTKLTLGHYSGMEAYTCIDLGLKSREENLYGLESLLEDESGERFKPVHRGSWSPKERLEAWGTNKA
ncbi:hypothetical protein FRC10_002679, partial [Ceratobasidium sp. 414]